MTRPSVARRLRFHASTWSPVLTVATAIFVLSSLPGSPVTALPFPHADKLAHAAIFSLLALTLLRALARATPRLSFRSQVLLTITGSSLYGVSDELHQILVPYRSCDLLDVAADLLGASAACAIVALLRSRLAKKRPPC